MSRPIGEPSVPLTQARQGYTDRQLLRRPSVNAFSEFGATTQPIWLQAFAQPTNCEVIGTTQWVYDFSFMALLSPQGSIWQLSITWWTGPDYGKMDFSMASLEAPPTDRPLGCPPGKIQPWDQAYGDALVYIQPVGSFQDFYSVTETQELVGGQGILQIVVGGSLGDPLTDLNEIGNVCANNTGADPYTLVNVMDGGPGWYRFLLQINGKNASSTGYRFRISSAALVRLDDVLSV